MTRGAARAERRRQQREAPKPHECSRRCWLPDNLCAVRIAYEMGPLHQTTVAELMQLAPRTIQTVEARAKQKLKARYPELASLLDE